MLAIAATIAGADGLLSKEALGDELCAAVRRLAHGRHYLPAVSTTVAHALRSRLGSADQAIFSMLLHGMLPQAIAERLGVPHEQIQVRRKLILEALKPHRTRSAVPNAHAPLNYRAA